MKTSESCGGIVAVTKWSEPIRGSKTSDTCCGTLGSEPDTVHRFRQNRLYLYYTNEVLNGTLQTLNENAAGHHGDAGHEKANLNNMEGNMEASPNNFGQHILTTSGQGEGNPAVAQNAQRRRHINGILWIIKTDAPWRDLPERYGKWGTPNP